MERKIKHFICHHIEERKNRKICATHKNINRFERLLFFLPHATHFSTCTCWAENNYNKERKEKQHGIRKLLQNERQIKQNPSSRRLSMRTGHLCRRHDSCVGHKDAPASVSVLLYNSNKNKLTVASTQTHMAWSASSCGREIHRWIDCERERELARARLTYGAYISFPFLILFVQFIFGNSGQLTTTTTPYSSISETLAMPERVERTSGGKPKQLPANCKLLVVRTEGEERHIT